VSFWTVLRSLSAIWARPRSLGADGWRVTLDRGGRAGWVRYEEPAGSFRFQWEMLSTGIGVMLGTAGDWDARCRRDGADWAICRREEIAGRMAQEMVRLMAPSARVEMWLAGFDLHF
jgi:hypothetical protein